MNIASALMYIGFELFIFCGFLVVVWIIARLVQYPLSSFVSAIKGLMNK